MPEYRELRKSNHRTIINMNLVTVIGFDIIENNAVKANVRFVDSQERSFRYKNVKDFTVDWPELGAAAARWIEQGLG